MGSAFQVSYFSIKISFMIKYAVQLFFILLFTSSIQAQYFSGEIVYKTIIIPKEGAELDEFVLEQDGRINRYLITNKRYQSTYYVADTVSYSYTYDNDTKRMYDYNRDNPYITYRDSRIANTDYYGSLIHRDSSLQVLDYECFVVESEADFRKTFTYYADDVKIDFESFDGHLVGNWYERLKEVDGCINLGSITEFDDYYLKTEVLEVIDRKVKKKEFDLPDLPVAASYAVLTKPVDLVQPTQEAIQCYQAKLKEASEIKGRSESYTSYVSFVVTKEGEMKYVSSVQDDAFGLDKMAVEMIRDCGFSFTAGEVNGEKVDSETFFPVEFKLD